MKNLPLSQPLRELAKKKFALLESQNSKKKLDTIQINLSGYSDVMYLMGDIIKVSMLALEGETSLNRIPEPNINISGVLGILLDMIPYEEAELLDALRESLLIEQDNVDEEDFILENLYLTMPSKLLD